MMDRYKFTVEWYNEYYDGTKEYGGQAQVDRGYVEGESIVEAVNKIAKYYGSETIEKLFLEPITNDSILIVEEDVHNFNTNWEGPAKNVGY